MKNNNNIVISQINQDWFDHLENWLYRSLNSFEAIGVPREDLEIYMPEYVLRMWQSYTSMRITGFLPTGTDTKFYGIKILNNYENQVTVSFRELVIRKKHPFKLDIP